MRKKEAYVYIFLAIIIGAIAFRQFSNGNEETDWRDSYHYERTIPYGTKVLEDQIQHFFLEGYVPAYSLALLKDGAIPSPSCYMMITDKWNASDSEIDSILSYVSEGETAIIAAEQLPEHTWKSLNLKHDEYLLLFQQFAPEAFDSLHLHFYHEDPYHSLSQSPPFPSLHFKRLPSMQFIPETAYSDSINIQLLVTDFEGQVFGWKMPWGEGALIVILCPKIFTNYYLLYEESYKWVERIFQEVPQEALVIWDRQYQPDPAIAIRRKGSLNYFLSQPTLKWAFWIGVGSILLIVLLLLKRHQKAIPVIAPLSNTTVEFAELIGQLYYEQGDHKGLAHKKIQHWRNDVYKRFHLTAKELDEEFMQELAKRSGLSLALIGATCQAVQMAEMTDAFSRKDLLRLCEAIDQFYLSIP